MRHTTHSVSRLTYSNQTYSQASVLTTVDATEWVVVLRKYAQIRHTITGVPIMVSHNQRDNRDNISRLTADTTNTVAKTRHLSHSHVHQWTIDDRAQQYDAYLASHIPPKSYQIPSRPFQIHHLTHSTVLPPQAATPLLTTRQLRVRGRVVDDLDALATTLTATWLPNGVLLQTTGDSDRYRHDERRQRTSQPGIHIDNVS